MTDQQYAPASIGNVDQASGLRQLFGEGFTRVWCLVSSLPGDPSVMVALGVANALRRAGQRVLLVDEVPLSDRSLMGGTPFPVRYDLGQVFSGLISIEKVVKPVGDKLWYCVATKLRRAREDKKAKLPTLPERLQKAGIDVDLVIVVSTDPHRATLQLLAEDMEHILMSGTDDEALDKSLHMIHELAVLFGGSPIPVLTVGGGSSEAGHASFEQLQARAFELLDQPLEHQGWVRASQLASEDSDTVETMMPSSLFRMMAGRIFAAEVRPDRNEGDLPLAKERSVDLE